MNDHGPDPAVKKKSSGVCTACRFLIELCALALIFMAAFSSDSSNSSVVSMYALFLAAVLLLVLLRRLESRVALLGIPLVFMYAYTRIDANRFSIRFSGDASIVVPAAVVVLAIMIYAFITVMLTGGVTNSLHHESALSLIAAVVFVSVMGVVLYFMRCTVYRCDWQELRSVIGNPFVLGMLFIVLRDHLSEPRAVNRFALYGIVFAVAALFMAVIR